MTTRKRECCHLLALPTSFCSKTMTKSRDSMTARQLQSSQLLTRRTLPRSTLVAHVGASMRAAGRARSVAFFEAFDVVMVHMMASLRLRLMLKAGYNMRCIFTCLLTNMAAF